MHDAKVLRSRFSSSVMSSDPPAPATAPERTPSPAPDLPLPAKHFYSVEYPGYVKPASVPRAIRTLGGQQRVDEAFRRGSGAAKSGTVLELSFRPDNPFAHPVPGDLVSTNAIVLKVVKRRRKRRVDEGVPEAGSSAQGVGEYTAEAVGVMHKTVRFRSAHTLIL